MIAYIFQVRIGEKKGSLSSRAAIDFILLIWKEIRNSGSKKKTLFVKLLQCEIFF